MSWIRLGVGLLLISFSFQSMASDDLVRVRLHKYNSSLTVQGVNIQSSQMQDFYSSLIVRQKIKFQRIYKDKKWLWKITDLKTKKESLSTDTAIDVSGEFMEVNYHLKVPSNLRLVGVNSRIDLIAILDIEEYLAGVLPNEMPLAWPEEALKAQAVASRSYTLSVLKERQHLHFDVEDTVEDQVFAWFPLASYPTQWRKKILNVLNETKGQYLIFNGFQPYKAYFHADSGGRTEPANYVWNRILTQPSYSVATSFRSSPNAHWTRTWKAQELAQSLPTARANLKNIKILSRTPSGRVEKIELEYEGGSKQVLTGQNFRKLLGYSRLKSTWFELDKKNQSFTFVGKGFGHGVGMCQWGARYLALQGKDYHEILNHYYPQTGVVRQTSEKFALKSQNQITF